MTTQRIVFDGIFDDLTGKEFEVAQSVSSIYSGSEWSTLSG
jgi:hypothetical protein